MTNKELQNILKTLPEDLEIWTSGDDEGNSIHKVPDEWCSIEKLSNNEIISDDDDYEYDDIIHIILIG